MVRSREYNVSYKDDLRCIIASLYLHNSTAPGEGWTLNLLERRKVIITCKLDIEVRRNPFSMFVMLCSRYEVYRCVFWIFARG